MSHPKCLSIATVKQFGDLPLAQRLVDHSPKGKPAQVDLCDLYEHYGHFPLPMLKVHGLFFASPGKLLAQSQLQDRLHFVDALPKMRAWGLRFREALLSKTMSKDLPAQLDAALGEIVRLHTQHKLGPVYAEYGDFFGAMVIGSLIEGRLDAAKVAYQWMLNTAQFSEGAFEHAMERLVVLMHRTADEGPVVQVQDILSADPSKSSPGKQKIVQRIRTEVNATLEQRLPAPDAGVEL